MDGEKRRALAIDDEIFVCKSIRKILELDSIETDIATSGREGLIMARSGDYDLVIIDVKMPEMNGYAVVRVLREIKPGLPVIVMSGYNTPHTREQAYLSGASVFIPKPFDPDEVRNAVLKFLKEGAPPPPAPLMVDGPIAAQETIPPRDMKVAVGYVCAPSDGGPGASIDTQKKNILKFALDNGIDLATVYEDSSAEIEASLRPAFLRILEAERMAGVLLVDSIGCIVRHRGELRKFLEKLDGSGMKLRAASSDMDYASQFVRSWYENEGYPEKRKPD